MTGPRRKAAPPPPGEPALLLDPTRPDMVITVKPGDRLVFVWPRADRGKLDEVRRYFEDRTQGWGVEAVHVANVGEIIHIPAAEQEDPA